MSDFLKKPRNRRNPSRIAEARLLAGLTQAQMAELIGVKRSAVCMYEKRSGNLSLSTLKKIAAALDISVHDLIDP